jgi:hypothetical protein
MRTYQAYQRGKASGAEVAKSVLYTGMPFAAGRMNRRTHTPDAPHAKGTKPNEPMTRPISDREAGAIAGTGPRTSTPTKPSHLDEGTTVAAKPPVLKTVIRSPLDNNLNNLSQILVD